MTTAEDEKVAGLLGELSPGQRATLTSGQSGWNTLPAAEVGLEAMLMGDGPLGLVSPTFDERETALLLPCGTALGATWDPAVLRSVAAVQGSEAQRRGYAAVYSPNLNLARTGLSGRTFEMYSEDPFLAGLLGAAFVRGLQGQGVAACPKHLVANDTETQRQSMSSTLDDTTLREVYLLPFEMALRDGGAWMVMTAYNRLNGIPCSTNGELISILKEEWGWDGLVLSDYFALKDTVGPALAGLDLEMPGPAIHLGPQLASAVEDGQVPQARVDDSVTRLLRLADRVGSLKGSTRKVSDPREHVDADDAAAVLAAAAAASFVLVKNEGPLLPLDAARVGTLAVIGPNSDRPTYQGATFGRVRPSGPVPTPLEGIQARFASATSVAFEPGVIRSRPEPLGAFDVRVPDGSPGVLLEHFRAGPAPVLREVRADTAFVWFGSVPGAGPTTEPGRLRMRAVFTPERSGPHTFGAGGSGETSLSIDGILTAYRPAPALEDVMGQVARAEMTTGTVVLTAGTPVSVEVEMTSAGARVQALTVGCLPPQPEGALDRAVRAAAAADTVVLLVGDVLETSRESRDLESSALPADQEELVRRVAAANSRTVVVLNSGRGVHAPWADEVAAVIYAWLPGQEFGTALADVLAGDREPSGRMPLTVTVNDEDRSTWGETLDDDLALDYTAREPTGYRHLERTGTAPRYAFGHGLGYTAWVHQLATADAATYEGTTAVTVLVDVKNVGRRSGKEVVQVYVRAPGDQDARLAAFESITLDPGATAKVSLTLDATALRRWDLEAAAWQIRPGSYDIRVARSSTEITHSLVVEV